MICVIRDISKIPCIGVKYDPIFFTLFLTVNIPVFLIPTQTLSQLITMTLKIPMSNLQCPGNILTGYILMEEFTAD